MRRTWILYSTIGFLPQERSLDTPSEQALLLSTAISVHCLPHWDFQLRQDLILDLRRHHVSIDCIPAPVRAVVVRLCSQVVQWCSTERISSLWKEMTQMIVSPFLSMLCYDYFVWAMAWQMVGMWRDDDDFVFDDAPQKKKHEAKCVCVCERWRNLLRLGERIRIVKK